MSKNLRALSRRKGLDQNLFEKITEVANISLEDRESFLRSISDEFLIGTSSVYGASSFYDFLTAGYAGKKVFICDGTACLVSGRQRKLKEQLLRIFKVEAIGTKTCLGLCHTNAAFLYNNKAYSLDENDKIEELIKGERHYSGKFNTGTNSSDPVLINNHEDIPRYYELIKKYSPNPEAALKEIELSRLRGRGGAGFPFHYKLNSVRENCGIRKIIVCNADEGDPGSFSDKWLLEERPHSVLFGMMVSGLIGGADTGIVYVRGEYPGSVASITKAVEQLKALDLTGQNIMGTGFNFSFKIIKGAGAYICGEETSLLNSIEGLRPEVRNRPPFPSDYGLFGNPTILGNVETFANIWYILKNGGAKYSSMGMKNSTGTKLVSLDGAFRKPGVYEVVMGTPVNYIFDKLGGGTRYPVKAFQIGGPLGGVVPAGITGNLSLDFESFASEGFLLGHAGIVSIPADFPMIGYIKHLFEFTSKESCGKCFPCRIGSQRGFELLEKAVSKHKKIDIQLFNDLLETLQLGSLCALGGGLPLPVRNILQNFNDELREYFTDLQNKV